MNINDFLTVMNQVPTEDLLRIAADLGNKVDLSSLDNLAYINWDWLSPEE